MISVCLAESPDLGPSSGEALGQTSAHNAWSSHRGTPALQGCIATRLGNPPQNAMLSGIPPGMGWGGSPNDPGGI